MASKILYNKETLEIIKCQSKPYGSGAMPSFEALCKSAFLAEDEKELVDTCVINERLFTNEAQEKYRIVDGEAIEKPKPMIKVDKELINLEDESYFTISVELLNTTAEENYEFIKIEIEDFEIEVELEDNKGEQTIQLTEEGTYIIKCADDRFRMFELEVRAI